MLKTYPIADGQASPCGGAFWVDLLDPTAEESERVARECGVKVPSRESLQEIETSSRTRVEGDVLYMSMPLAIQDGSRGLAPVPLGFILSPQRLVTVRYSEVHAFAQVMERVQSDRRMNSASTFVALIDGMVDFDADMLEKLSGDLAAVSGRAFGQGGVAPAHDKHHSRALRECVNSVGTVGERLSRIRETLLGLQRIIGFVSEAARDGQALLPELRTHLKTARQDVASLVEFESHLSGKTQFLLDAVLGFINTEQNEIFKVLTIVSVVGIPPTLIASMYGMNFHYMPELAWRWGYPYGLALIGLSTLVPIIWFKRRGWW
ncbi:MAG TPA: magnesium transporter CorA family protein [Steroidobacteraceae bacterium]|jgi:magnesium transporter